MLVQGLVTSNTLEAMDWSTQKISFQCMHMIFMEEFCNIWIKDLLYIIVVGRSRGIQSRTSSLRSLLHVLATRVRGIQSNPLNWEKWDLIIITRWLGPRMPRNPISKDLNYCKIPQERKHLDPPKILYPPQLFDQHFEENAAADHSRVKGFWVVYCEFFLCGMWLVDKQGSVLLSVVHRIVISLVC